MKELLLSISVLQFEVALRAVLPFLLWGGIAAVLFYFFLYFGRRIERFEWQRELEAGNRMGEVVKRKIQKRDDRIKQLTKDLVHDEAELDEANKQQVEINSLLIEIFEVIRAKSTAKARRRRA